MDAAQMPFSTSFDERSSTLTVLGEVDYRDVDQLAKTLRVCGDRDLVVDLSGVTYLPSAVLTVLVSAARRSREQGTTMTIGAAPGSIAHRVLQVTGLLTP